MRADAGGVRRLVRGRRLVWGQRVPPAGPLDSCDSNRGRGLVWGRSGCMALMWGTVMLWRRRGEDAQLSMDGPAVPGLYQGYSSAAPVLRRRVEHGQGVVAAEVTDASPPRPLHASAGAATVDGDGRPQITPNHHAPAAPRHLPRHSPRRRASRPAMPSLSRAGDGRRASRPSAPARACLAVIRVSMRGPGSALIELRHVRGDARGRWRTRRTAAQVRRDPLRRP